MVRDHSFAKPRPRKVVSSPVRGMGSLTRARLPVGLPCHRVRLPKRREGKRMSASRVALATGAYSVAVGVRELASDCPKWPCGQRPRKPFSRAAGGHKLPKGRDLCQCVLAPSHGPGRSTNGPSNGPNNGPSNRASLRRAQADNLSTSPSRCKTKHLEPHNQSTETSRPYPGSDAIALFDVWNSYPFPHLR